MSCRRDIASQCYHTHIDLLDSESHSYMVVNIVADILDIPGVYLCISIMIHLKLF